jgi:hypothetical protein
VRWLMPVVNPGGGLELLPDLSSPARLRMGCLDRTADDQQQAKDYVGVRLQYRQTFQRYSLRMRKMLAYMPVSPD